MIRVCSWCERFLGDKEPLEDQRVTHSVCELCAQQMLASEEDEREQFRQAEPRGRPAIGF